MTKYMTKRIKDIAGNGKLSVMHHALHTEKELGKVCRRVWEHTNPQGSKFIFAKYIDPNDRSDETIVTLGFYCHLTYCYRHI